MRGFWLPAALFTFALALIASPGLHDLVHGL
jgi:hypothetical protein